MVLAQSRQAESKQHLAVVRSCHERGLEVARMMAEVVLGALSAVADVCKWVCYILTRTQSYYQRTAGTNNASKKRDGLIGAARLRICWGKEDGCLMSVLLVETTRQIWLCNEHAMSMQ
jgi:hypothetical protein